MKLGIYPEDVSLELVIIPIFELDRFPDSKSFWSYNPMPGIPQEEKKTCDKPRGLTGICGIVPSIGACFSILTGSRCGTDKEQRITMEAVSRISRAITALTGPGCCKAYVRVGLEVAVRYLTESLGIALPSHRIIRCKHSLRHPHGCRKQRCPYFDT